MTVEERLRSALHEVADRLPARDVAPPAPSIDAQRGTRRWELAVAAAVIVAALVGAFMLARGDGGSVPVATEMPRTLLTTTLDGDELRLETTDGDCVTLVSPYASNKRGACLGDEPLAIEIRLMAGKTVVYGIADPGVRFRGTIEELTRSDLLDARVGSGAAFLLVIDGPAASGTVTVFDDSNHALATAAFDHGGPAREPTETLGDRTMDFAFLRDGAIWVHATDGRDFRVTDGSVNAPDGYPLALPDGHTIVHTVATFDMPFDAIVATDARDGSVRDLQLSGTGLLALSPDGTRIAATHSTDDSAATVELVLLDATTFGEITSVPIGVWDDVGDVWDASWDAAGQSLLVVTHAGCCPTGQQQWADRLWFVDVRARAATELNAPWVAEWSLADRANDMGAFPTLFRHESDVEWGALRIDGASLTYEDVGPPPTDVGFDTSGDIYLVAHGDGFWLVGDGSNLFELDAEGHLKLLLRDVTRAATP